MPSVFEYPITRPFTLPYLTLGIVVFGVLWATFITLVNVAAIGYESLSVISASFNSTGALWYEKFAPTASWFPQSWTCDPSTIQRGQDLLTTSGNFDYTLTGFVDQVSDSAIGGMAYSNTPFRNCSLPNFSLVADKNGVNWDVELTCNTSAMQYLSATAGSVHTPYGQGSLGFHPIPSNGSIPGNGSMTQQWLTAFEAMNGWIGQVLGGIYDTNSNLTEIEIASDMGECGSEQDNGLWDLSMSTNSRGSDGYNFTVTVNSTGQVTSNASIPHDIFIGWNTGFSSFEEWCEFVARAFYIRYWLHLADLGQTSEFGYFQTSASDYSYPYVESCVYPAAYNIFVNETLYYNYFTYIHNLLNQPLNHFEGVLVLLNLKFTTPLQPIDTMFLQSYSCQKRVLKSGVSLLISIIVADYAFIVGAYSLFIWVAGAIQKRQKSANCCGQCWETKTSQDGKEYIKIEELEGLERTSASVVRRRRAGTV